MYILVQIINGLSVGSIYALIALGYTMVYGIVKLINFAHGDLMMVGAYISLFALTDWGMPFYLAIPISMIITALIGVLIERIAYKPLRGASRLSALITAIGVSLLLQNLFMFLFKADPRRYPTIEDKLPVIHLGDYQLSTLPFITIAGAITLMLLLQVFIKKTKIGKAMRAVSEDSKAAKLMGINVDVTISITFAIGSALAAFAAALFCLAYPQVSPFIGQMPGLKAFIAAVLGGIGYIPGAMLGGFILGLIESLSSAYIPSAYSQLSNAVVFSVLILVLLVKPSGLLGRNEREKV